MVIGEHEDFVPQPLMAAYAAAASKAGDAVRLVVLPKADLESSRLHGPLTCS